jgi:hypothetical protein
MGQNSISVSYSVDGYNVQPPTSPASPQILTFSVKECAIETLAYNPTPDFQIDGGTTQVVNFQNYVQKHSTGNDCLYPLSYEAYFCVSYTCQWQELPEWILISS